jgi:hypothetical protein
MGDINGAHPGEAKDDAIADLVIINKTLAATESTAAECRKKIENEVLERAAKACDEVRATYEKSGLTHRNNSEARERCFLRANGAAQAESAVLALKKG